MAPRMARAAGVARVAHRQRRLSQVSRGGEPGCGPGDAAEPGIPGWRPVLPACPVLANPSDSPPLSSTLCTNTCSHRVWMWPCGLGGFLFCGLCVLGWGLPRTLGVWLESRYQGVLGGQDGPASADKPCSSGSCA